MTETLETPTAKIYQFTIVDGRQSTDRPLWKKALTAVILVACLYGPGLVFDSAAMQWAGFVLTVLLPISIIKIRTTLLTIEQARAKLDELEREGPAVTP